MGRVFCTYLPGEDIVTVYAAPNPFLLNKICLNQGERLGGMKCTVYDPEVLGLNPG